MAVTPMMQQYLDIKSQHTDAIVFFRLGDFYEMFFDDAKLVSRELELTLTGRDCGEGQRAPMCGVPYHSADTYINRLVTKGYKVVICEQTEDPALAKGLVKREITRIITPGTLIDNSVLSESKNNYLAAVYVDGSDIAVAFTDISTGDISVVWFSGHQSGKRLVNELSAYMPSEIIINVPCNTIPELQEFLSDRLTALVWESKEERFDRDSALAAVKSAFGDVLAGGNRDDAIMLPAVGALLDYITETQKLDRSYIKNLNIYKDGQFLELDANTRRNLELTETMRSKEKRGSLLWVLDHTNTSMGARLLRKWVEQPLVNTYYITRRQNAVEELCISIVLRNELAERLKVVLDLERLMAKVVYATAGGRDLRAISSTLSVIPEIKQMLCNVSSDELTDVRDKLDTLSDVYDKINAMLIDDPPFSVREGGMIRPGASTQVDELRDIMSGGHGAMERIEAREREVTGIPKLKIGYNQVFGYYIEISKAALAQSGNKIPPHYIRKQTLTNAERYITEELKNAESTVLGASDRLTALEYELFCQLRDYVAGEVKRIQASASRLALLDVYISLAETAAVNNYVRPYVDYTDSIIIKDGRHPVVEKFVEDNYFVPNDTKLDTSHNRLMLITGPNMSGKSTYMRQVALITLMAQIGSFVPATEADIGVVDKIFTRVGASDDLASGQSTFMLEMTEVAYILKNATRRSLIIYDEIGRGTSTYDGMSIARAVLEYTAGRKLGAKTLFATHYHELTSLEGAVEGVINYNIAAKKRGEEVTFLRRIIRGAADDSYGIEVARLAGIPNEITKRAREVLRELEIRTEELQAALNAECDDEESLATELTNITLDDLDEHEAAERIRNCELDAMTPIEALNFIYDLKRLLKR